MKVMIFKPPGFLKPLFRLFCRKNAKNKK